MVFCYLPENCATPLLPLCAIRHLRSCWHVHCSVNGYGIWYAVFISRSDTAIDMHNVSVTVTGDDNLLNHVKVLLLLESKEVQSSPDKWVKQI